MATVQGTQDQISQVQQMINDIVEQVQDTMWSYLLVGQYK